MTDRVLALFAGAGGFSTGFSAAGCKPTVAADVDPDAAQTYADNLGVACHVLDLGVLDANARSLLSLDRSAFAVIGGPPCQGFSTAGGRDGSDPRNRLIFNYFDIVQTVRPRWFMFENVEGILTSNGGHSVHSLVQQFVELGYWVRLDKLNFASFGLPQARKRVVIVGNRVGVPISMPLATHSFCAGKHKSISNLPSSPTLNEALAGLGKATKEKAVLIPYATEKPASYYDGLMREGNASGRVSQHFCSTTEKDAERFRHLKPGQTMKDLPEELWHDSFRRRAFRRVQDGTPTEKRGGAPSGLKRLVGGLNALTITSAANREFIHPREDRPLTLREAARLQAFPDHYTFVGNAISVAKQIGNAFPPMVSKLFAENIMRLDGGLGADVGSARLRGAPRLLGFTLTDASGMSPALARTEAMLEALCDTQQMLPLLAS